MNPTRSMDVADGLRWGLIPLVVLIGLTSYVATDDVALSFAFTATLGLTALVSAWLLLRGLRGGATLAGVSAAAVILVQFVDVNTIALGWMRLSYVAIGSLTLAWVAAEVIASRWVLRQRMSRQSHPRWADGRSYGGGWR